MQENISQDPKTLLLIIVGIVIGAFIWYLFAKIYFLWKIKSQRKHAVKRSRDVVLWQVTEQLAPLLPNFPYYYKDLMFLGKGVDYVVFDWLSEWNLEQIVFLEVKTWRSQLNKNERMIKQAIKSWNVSYDILRL